MSNAFRRNWKEEAEEVEEPDYDLDPRPDLKEDSELWQRVLAEAISRDDQSHAALHAARVLGCVLEVTEDGLRIEPHIDATRATGFTGRDKYNTFREEVLLQCVSEVKAVFDAVTQKAA